ncbi:hypothetical protein FEM48_Zijuj01G0052800 [Ziziphus jujuba var. spinosa]|uniref:Dynamin-type G domain-containing protein n=1 Tax=Ziziphus jujuba var. spinosa TaxID=714518 RepID=A0A978VZC2_ZIZJJ|nr:hypothetical protein FEM48_Zijuj01G0052800 [Ziziphus jujuba var. spinosa]
MRLTHSLALATVDPDVPIYAPIVSSYNYRIRPLLDAVDKLRNLMVMEEGIPLPTIVVVVDQSSGKSNVLESLAGISLPRDENHVSEAINLATDEIVGNGKGISNDPLTLVVKKKGVPDLTMVDLPGITTVPIHGQPENIYEQIRDIIMEYIIPEESIILNVLSATVDFTTCESIRMSQSVDKTGERTLAVVTKVDKAPEGLLEKATADDVNIGLGYVYVGADSSFYTIARNLPEIVKYINDKLNSNISELNKLPKNMSSAAEANYWFSQESLRKILLRGEFDEYPDDKRMHCTVRLIEMINQFSDQLHNSVENDRIRDFLMEEIRILEESKEVGLPNFLPRTAFLSILLRKVNAISHILIDFVGKLWDYIEDVVMTVLKHHVEDYHQLQLATKRAANNLIAKMKERSNIWMTEIVEMEKVTDFTCIPEYVSEWTKLMTERDAFIGEILKGDEKLTSIKLEGVRLEDEDDSLLENSSEKVGRWYGSAFAIKCEEPCKGLEFEDANEIYGKHVGGIERLMEENPSVASKTWEAEQEHHKAERV